MWTTWWSLIKQVMWTNMLYFDGNMGYKNERIFDSQMAVIWLPNGLKFGHQKNQNSADK